MSGQTPLPLRQPSRADLVSLTASDIAEVAGFIAAQSGRTKESVEAHLRWFLLENPALQSQDPLGFGLRSADQLVGCILCSPQIFRFQNRKVPFMGSSSFYVDEAHRGHGGRIFLQYSKLGKERPLFGTSANADAAALWKAAGGNPILYSDRELFGVLHWPPVAEEFVYRRHAGSFLTRLAGSSISRAGGLLWPFRIDDVDSNPLRPITSAEEALDLPIDAASPKLTAFRDLPYLRWRYFSGRDATVAAFSFRSHQPDQEVLVTVNQRPRGYRDQIATLNILDVYPEVSAGDLLRIAGGLAARYKNTVDALVLRSVNPIHEKLLIANGFQLRFFDAPNGWFLDKRNLLAGYDWYPVAADGDGLI